MAAGRTPPRTDPFAHLTPREYEILDLLAAGRSTAHMARSLHLATKTVSNNLSVIFGKLGVANRTEAALLARQAGLGGPREPGGDRHHPA